MDFDIKIIFWVLAIGFYIYTQIKDSLKKDKRTDPIPDPIPKLPSIPGMNRSEKKPAPANTYTTPAASKPSKKYQSKYSREEEVKQVSREAFYKEENRKPVVVNYEDPKNNNLDAPSLFGVDQHLKPYELHKKQKHPLMTFLSDKNNLKNAFITGEILKRRD